MNTPVKVAVITLGATYSTVMGVLTAKAVKDLFNRTRGTKVNVVDDVNDIDDNEVADAE